MLELSFSRIQNSKEPLTHIERDLEMRPEFFKRSKDLLIDAKNVKVSGDLFYQEPFVTGSFHVTADLVVPSSRSLKPVDYHEDFTFTENYLDRKPTKEELEENDTIVQVENDQIDLQTAVEDKKKKRIFSQRVKVGKLFLKPLLKKARRTKLTQLLLN